MSSFQSPTPSIIPPGINELSRLAPTRSRDAVSKQWQTGNQTTRHLNAVVNNVRRNRYELQKVQARSLAPVQMHPFKVYNVPRALCPTKGTYGGQAYDPATDAWRTFRVRIGNMSMRPKWFLPETVGLVGNNYESIQLVESGSDGNWKTVNSRDLIEYVDYDEDNYSLSNYYGDSEVLFVSGNNSGGQAPPITVTTDGSLATFVLPYTMFNATSGVIQASFWAQVDGDTDDSTPPVPKIYCRAFNDYDTNPTIFPPDGIPIAEVATQSLFSAAAGVIPPFSVNQLQYNHVVNRFTTNSTTYRGNWDDDELSGQVFYPGDVVTIFDELQMKAPPNAPSVLQILNGTDNLGVNGVALFRPFVYRGTPDFITDRPTYDLSGHWRPLAWFY